MDLTCYIPCFFTIEQVVCLPCCSNHVISHSRTETFMKIKSEKWMSYRNYSMIDASLAIFLNPATAGFPGTVFVEYPARENARW